MAIYIYIVVACRRISRAHSVSKLLLTGLIVPVLHDPMVKVLDFRAVYVWEIIGGLTLFSLHSFAGNFSTFSTGRFHIFCGNFLWGAIFPVLIKLLCQQN